MHATGGTLARSGYALRSFGELRFRLFAGGVGEVCLCCCLAVIGEG